MPRSQQSNFPFTFFCVIPVFVLPYVQALPVAPRPENSDKLPACPEMAIHVSQYVARSRWYFTVSIFP